MGDKSRGLYNKFRVERVDGSSAPGGKHDGCEYFVLDLTHDKHAKVALLAYAESCKTEVLGIDIMDDGIRDNWPIESVVSVVLSDAYDAVAADARRYRHLKKIMHWDDDRDSAPGGRYWLALLTRERKPDIDALIDSQADGKVNER